MKVIDCYGYEYGTKEFRNKERTPDGYAQNSAKTKTFIRYGTGNPCAIWCVDESNTTTGTTIRWAWGNWANRESLTFSTSAELNLSVSE